MRPTKYKNLMIALLLIGATHIALGSFTGTSGKKSNNIYSLKNFNKNFYKSASPFSLRANLSYKGIQMLSQKKEANGDITYTSMMRYERGNTTYIYPYTHKVSASRFITPTRPSFR